MAYTEYDEHKLKALASRLDEVASKYESLIFDVKTGKNALSEWDSPAADQWRGKVDAFITDASASVEELRSTAATIRSFTVSMHTLLEKLEDKVKELLPG